MPPSIQEKTALLRRQHIIEAAIGVFAERGFHRATIRDIAVAAGVADGTIYNSFANKGALLLGILDPLNEAADHAQPLPPKPGADMDVETLVRSMFRSRWATFTPEVLKVLQVVFSEVLTNEELRELFMRQVIEPALTLPEPVFQELAHAGKIRPVNLPMLLRMITASFLGLVMLRLLEDEMMVDQWEDVPEQLAELLLGGLLPAKKKRK